MKIRTNWIKLNNKAILTNRHRKKSSNWLSNTLTLACLLARTIWYACKWLLRTRTIISHWKNSLAFLKSFWSSSKTISKTWQTMCQKEYEELMWNFDSIFMSKFSINMRTVTGFFLHMSCLSSIICWTIWWTKKTRTYRNKEVRKRLKKMIKLKAKTALKMMSILTRDFNRKFSSWKNWNLKRSRRLMKRILIQAGSNKTCGKKLWPWTSWKPLSESQIHFCIL